MSNEQFREKIGLDYLIKRSGPAPVPETAGQKEIDWALQAQSMRVLAALQQSTGEAHLLELVELLDADLFTLKKAADYLAASGLVEVAAAKTGNDEVKLTAKGRNVRV